MRSLWSLRGLAAAACATVLAATLAVPAGAVDSPEPEPTLTPSKWVRAGAPLDGWVIAIDPGHNGANATDPEASELVSDGRGDLKTCNSGGTETASGYPEHAFAFDVAQRLSARLESLGADVVMTREDDEGVGPCVDVRGRFAEDVDADLMVSLHANGSRDTSISGYFAIVSDPAISPSQGSASRQLAAEFVEALADRDFEPSTAVEDPLVLRDDLATLNFARRPTVLLELGEMRNPGDAAVMQKEAGRQRYAVALASGVLSWASDHQPKARTSDSEHEGSTN